MSTLKEKNLHYWSGRAHSYSQYNQGELQDDRKQLWGTALKDLITNHFPDRSPADIHVLDIGTGPGFFALILKEAGYQVTAIDCTENMLQEAKGNTGVLAEQITWVLGDVQELPFPSEQFDILVSRNVTWNLPHPRQAYREWLRVLKPLGALFNFDANWYNYLFDEAKRAEYNQDRQNVANHEMEDFNIGENFDQMEQLALKMPLSKRSRPAWDMEVLREIGCSSFTADTDIWKRVWSDIEQINNASTPTFLVTAVK